MSLILPDIICWAFVIYCLFSGRKAKNLLPSGSSTAVIITFVILGGLLVYRFYPTMGMYSLVHCAIIVLAGVVYSSIPSGYDDEGIYIRGRKYWYKKMTSMEVNEEKKCYRMTFVYRKRPYFTAVKKEDRYLLEDIQMRYRKARILK